MFVVSASSHLVVFDKSGFSSLVEITEAEFGSFLSSPEERLRFRETRDGLQFSFWGVRKCLMYVGYRGSICMAFQMDFLLQGDEL